MCLQSDLELLADSSSSPAATVSVSLLVLIAREEVNSGGVSPSDPQQRICEGQGKLQSRGRRFCSEEGHRRSR